MPSDGRRPARALRPAPVYQTATAARHDHIDVMDILNRSRHAVAAWNNWIASGDRPTAFWPVDHTLMDRDGGLEAFRSPRKITAFPAFRHNAPRIRRHIGPTFKDDAHNPRGAPAPECSARTASSIRRSPARRGPFPSAPLANPVMPRSIVDQLQPVHHRTHSGLGLGRRHVLLVASKIACRRSQTRLAAKSARHNFRSCET